MILESRLKRLKKDDLISVVRVMERRANTAEEFIRERSQRIKEKTLQQIHEDIKRWHNVTEVVRCKDCKHYNKDDLWCGMNSKDRSAWFNWYEDDFCSYGERKDNGSE